MKYARKKKIMSILSVCISIGIFFNIYSGLVYAEENEYTIPDEISEQQDKIKEIQQPKNTTFVPVEETEVLNEVPENNIKSNVLEHQFSGQIEAGVQFNDSMPKDKAVKQNTDPNYAYLVSNDTVTQGTIENENEFRWYAFSIDKKSKISIVLQMETNLDADLFMFSLNQDTATLDLIGGSATEGLGIQEYYNAVLEPGIYFFSAAGYSGVGNFAFAYYESSIDSAYEVNDNADLSTDVALSTDITGVIDSPYDQDYYKFTVTKPIIMRYNISTSNGYKLGYVKSSGSAPIIVDGTMIKVKPGTYYFAVYSPNGSYSANSTYKINFKKIGGYVDENLVPFRAISEEAGVVFQTNFGGTSYYVNGNQIDISYAYSYEASNSGGSQSYHITLSNMPGVHCQIWDEEIQGPDVVYYHSSTKPNINVGSKYLLRLMIYSSEESIKFYRIMCRGTGAYVENTLFMDPIYAIVLIDPDTGKLVDISEPNYFYDYAMGSNKITTSGRRDMVFDYHLEDFID